MYTTYQTTDQIMAQKLYALEEINFDGNPTGLYKLGLTTRDVVQMRINEYKAGNPRELRTMYVVDVPNAQEAETYLHKRFNGQRLVGKKGGDEWFQFAPVELESVIFEMDQQGTPGMKPVITASKTSSEQFIYNMGVGAWWTALWFLRAALWTVKPVAKHNYSDGLAKRILKYPLSWLLIAFVLFQIINKPPTTTGKKTLPTYVKK